MTKIDLIQSDKIKAMSQFLNKKGVKISYFGKAWSNEDANWIYFDCKLNIIELIKLFDPSKQLVVHENIDPRSGLEKGLIDNSTGEGIMGKLIWDMSARKTKIELIVRGLNRGVQLDVKEFPIFCPCCKNYLKEIYEHQGSRYGQVGSIDCDCGEKLYLTDSDNIVEYINIHVRNVKTVLDFKDLFKMRQADFEKLKNDYGYDIYEKYLNNRIELDNLIVDIEKYNCETIIPIETEFPSTIGIQKWLSLMNKKRMHNNGYS